MAMWASFSLFGRQAAKIGTGFGKASPCIARPVALRQTAIATLGPLRFGVDVAQVHGHKLFLAINLMPLRAKSLAHSPVNRADLVPIGFGLDLCEDLFAE